MEAEMSCLQKMRIIKSFMQVYRFKVNIKTQVGTTSCWALVYMDGMT